MVFGQIIKIHWVTALDKSSWLVLLLLSILLVIVAWLVVLEVLLFNSIVFLIIFNILLINHLPTIITIHHLLVRTFQLLIVLIGPVVYRILGELLYVLERHSWVLDMAAAFTVLSLLELALGKLNIAASLHQLVQRLFLELIIIVVFVFTLIFFFFVVLTSVIESVLCEDLLLSSKLNLQLLRPYLIIEASRLEVGSFFEFLKASRATHVSLLARQFLINRPSFLSSKAVLVLILTSLIILTIPDSDLLFGSLIRLIVMHLLK